MTTGPLAKEWRSYRATIIPSGAQPIQIEECQRAFYAGALASFSVCTHTGEDSVSEADGVRILGALADELREYISDFKRRHGSTQ